MNAAQRAKLARETSARMKKFWNSPAGKRERAKRNREAAAMRRDTKKQAGPAALARREIARAAAAKAKHQQPADHSLTILVPDEHFAAALRALTAAGIAFSSKVA